MLQENNMKSTQSTIGKLQRIIDLANEALKELKHPASSNQKHDRIINQKKGPQYFIGELIDDGFLKQGKSIELIRKKLQEEWHNYSQEELGTPLRRLVLQKRLKREKVGPQYLYQQR